MGVTKKHLGQWRSIEFECWFINDKAQKEFKAFVKKNHYTKQIDIGWDDSIEPDSRDCDKCLDCRAGRKWNCARIDELITAEIRVSFISGKDKIVRDVCAFLKGRAKVNDSCGTHVHFDMRDVDESAVRVYGVKLACAIPALKKLLPRERRKSYYCEIDLNSVDSNDDWGDDRHAFINLQAYHRHKTIEVRGHSGTLDADKILNWIALCEKIMYGNVAKVIKTIKEPKKLRKQYGLGKDLASYITKRAKEVSKRSFVEA